MKRIDWIGIIAIVAIVSFVSGVALTLYITRSEPKPAVEEIRSNALVPLDAIYKMP